MTASQLHAAFLSDGCQIVATEDGVGIRGAIPPKLEPYIEILHTGLRAIVLNRRWFGTDSGGRALGPHAMGAGLLREGALDRTKPLPPAVAQLFVEGPGEGVDDVPTDAVDRLPDAFQSGD
jgi:hypothetical protein